MYNVELLKPKYSISFLQYSLDGKYLVSGSDTHELIVWSPDEMVPLRSIQGWSGVSVETMAISPSNTYIVTGTSGFEDNIFVWEFATGTLRRTLLGHSDTVNALAITADERLLFSGGARDIKTWDLASGQLVHVYAPDNIDTEDEVLALFLTADGRSIGFSYAGDPGIKVADLADWKVRYDLGHAWDEQSSGIPLAYSRQTNCVFAMGDYQTNAILKWSLDTGAQVGTITGIPQGGRELILSPDARHFAIDSGAGIEIWDAINGHVLHTIESKNTSGGEYLTPTAVAFAPAGDKFACAFDYQSRETSRHFIDIIDTRTGTLLRSTWEAFHRDENIMREPTLDLARSVRPDLDAQENEVLKEIEVMLGKNIPELRELASNPFGYVKAGAHVVGLGLSDQKLATLPGSLFGLHELRQLNLSHNSLELLPSKIAQLSSLERLWLQGNKLKAIPEQIGTLPLRFLHLGLNQIEVIPASFGKLYSLQELFLPGNNLTQFPSGIEQFLSLQKLDLSHNRIEIIPASIGQLTSLVVLKLHMNRITEVPATVGNLVSLKTLTLSVNPIHTLPETIKNLQSLESLWLEHLPLQLPGTLKTWVRTLKKKGCEVRCDEILLKRQYPPQKDTPHF